MNGISKRRWLVRLSVGIPYLPLQLTLKTLSKVGEKSEELEQYVTRLLLDKYVIPIEKKLGER